MLPEEQPRQVSFERERGITEIRVTPGVAYMFVRAPAGEDLTAHRLRILEILREENVSLFLIKLQRYGISFGVPKDSLKLAQKRLETDGYTLTTRENRAMVSVFAQNMREMHEVMAVIGEAFFQAGAPIEQVGAAHNRMICLIDAEHAPQAVDRLRKAFGLNEFAVKWGGAS